MEKPNKHILVAIADAYRAASGVPQESTVSYRVFGDTKKLTQLRGAADITVARYSAAMDWFVANWPEGHSLPRELAPWAVPAIPAAQVPAHLGDIS